MLRNGTRTVTSKQALMADQTPSLSSPSPYETRAKSSIFGSPRLINDGFRKDPSVIKTMSPTSILDVKQFSPRSNQAFGYDKTRNLDKNPSFFSGNKRTWEDQDPRGIGLALAENSQNNSPLNNTRKVMFGFKLKIRIPGIPPSLADSPKSPGDFGTKTQNSPSLKSPSPFENPNPIVKTGDMNSPRVFDLSATEMELSEEYTRVIAHGPSPRTIHIYDGCVLESCDGVVGLSESKRGSSLEKSNPPPESFLSFCCTCKKSLEQGKDIYIYRGEKGFCSHECRCKEMLSDGEDSLP